MEPVVELLSQLNGIAWGPAMLALLGGTGIFLTIRLGFLQFRKLGYGFRQLWAGRRDTDEDGDISAFNALMTAMAATIGTGNIAGVATAIAAGGPGALFWMWCIALIGMATKYAEAVLAVRFRETDEYGNHVGGPMYYIRNDMGARWAWLGTLFAFFGAIAGFGIGNTVQANSVADALASTFGIQHWITGLVLAALVAVVLIGGVQRIAQVAGKLVPFMALAYVVCGSAILLVHAGEVPSALVQIVEAAFNPTAQVGGFAGATVWAAIRFGVARGVFSNEAGLGSAPIAHAAAKTNNPVRQGTIAMLGTFLDTIVVCTITGLVIVVTGAWTSGESGASLSSMAFAYGMPDIGAYVVSIGLVLFAFTTLLGWSYYGERCAEFLFGVRAIQPFRILWVVAVPIGATISLDFVWLLADTLNALMAVPNLIALLALSPVVVALTREHFSRTAD